MKLIVGLGNPGEKYKNNRHNAGFMVIDAIVKKLKVSHVEKKLDSLTFYHHESGTVFARPLTFMNNSGVAVKKLLIRFKVKPEDLLVIHDDLDIALGDYKIQYAKGPKIHGGITDIEQNLSTEKFWRIRVGVDNRKPESREEGIAYVLQDFREEEMVILEGIINKVIKEIFNRIS